MPGNDDVQARIAAHVHREPGLTLIEIRSRIGSPAWGVYFHAVDTLLKGGSIVRRDCGGLTCHFPPEEETIPPDVAWTDSLREFAAGFSSIQGSLSIEDISQAFELANDEAKVGIEILLAAGMAETCISASSPRYRPTPILLSILSSADRTE